MKAIVYERPGDTSVLQLRDIDRPEPAQGEVRVRLAVSGVNPSDWKSRAHALYGGPEGEFKVPHQDGAGVIDAVGPGVDTARIGERVWIYFAAWGRRWGTAAQWTVLPAEQAVRLPAHASNELGATLGIPALTAFRCLMSDGPIDGANVLVTGGAGAVGYCAIQLAKWAGARVITTVSSEEKAQVAGDAGADVIVNYRDDDMMDQLRAAAPDGVARVVDVAVAVNGKPNIANLAPGGVIAAYATDGGQNVDLPIRALMDKNALLRFVMIYRVPRDELRHAIAGVSEAVEAGALSKLLPLRRFPLEETAAAHEALEKGGLGRVLVDIP